MSTEFSAQTGTRGSSYGFSDFALTNETRTISTIRIVPVFVDRADLAQANSYVNQMAIAERQGALIQEVLESQFLGQHASWTDFGTNSIGGGGAETTQITVDTSNVDDIVRNVKRRIFAANGIDMANRNGVAFVWRPADMEKLEAFAQANGFQLADMALKNGIPNGYRLFGCEHYISNDHTANHVFAGVKKAGSLGILKATYGQIVITQDPVEQSGIGIISRVDYGFAWWNNNDSLYYDVNVA